MFLFLFFIKKRPFEILHNTFCRCNHNKTGNMLQDQCRIVRFWHHNKNIKLGHIGKSKSWHEKETQNFIVKMIPVCCVENLQSKLQKTSGVWDQRVGHLYIKPKHKKAKMILPPVHNLTQHLNKGYYISFLSKIIIMICFTMN